jgi:hypothetical protein
MAIKTNNEHPDRVPPIVTPVDSLMTWERGKKFGSKLTSIVSRYPNTVSHIFEIERNGKAGDTQTTYEIYETGVDEGVRLEDFEVNDPVGTIILDKTAEEMQNFVDTGDFGMEAPQRRPSTPAPSAPTSNGGGFARRTPASGEGTRRPF